MIRHDLHTHTTFCDGSCSAEEMVLAAIDRGLEEIGFSGHGFTSFDTEWCMSEENTVKYLDELDRLRELYGDRIVIRAGSEWDYYSDGCRDRMEYFIGSVHYVERNGIRVSVDESPETFVKMVKELYDGDYFACAEDFYKSEADVINRTGADIIGHFDLVTKFNEGDILFDTSDPRYKAAWTQAADELLKTGRPFEINTGAISRGYRKTPYPSNEIMDYIGTRGGAFILSSDSHRTDTLLYGFEELEKLVHQKGYRLLETIFD